MDASQRPSGENARPMMAFVCPSNVFKSDPSAVLQIRMRLVARSDPPPVASHCPSVEIAIFHIRSSGTVRSQRAGGTCPRENGSRPIMAMTTAVRKRKRPRMGRS